MNASLFDGKLVRLKADEPDVVSKAMARWSRNAEYIRYLFTSAAAMMSARQIKEWLEKDLDQEHPEGYFFNIHIREDDRLIGHCVLWQPDWSHRDTWLTIGIGEADAWGKGYGTDAVRLLLRYAFEVLNLERVSLGTFGYNLRAIRSYEKAGFVQEGRLRKAMRRDGSRFDICLMGAYRSDWLSLQEGINHAG